jgi:sec-independent protein translocase protein TatA
MGAGSMHFLPALIFDSPMDILVVVLVFLLLFGGKKIPELMKGLGQGIKEFKDGMRDEPPSQTPPSTSTPATPEKK